MITRRPGAERGRTSLDWLESFHTFSFGQYVDPKHTRFGHLRVINDDVIAPGGGFGTHPHRDMEIFTYMLDGALEHEDSMGNRHVLRAGGVQAMTAGRGVTHSEFNASQTEPARLLQIWIMPRQRGLEPAWADRQLDRDSLRGALSLLASEDGRDDSLVLNQDAAIYATILDDGQEVSHALADGRRAWVQVARGSLQLNGQSMNEGDGAAVEGESRVTLRGASADAEALLFDLP